MLPVEAKDLYLSLVQDNDQHGDRNTAGTSFYVLMAIATLPGAIRPLAFYVCDVSSPELGEPAKWDLTVDFRKANHFAVDVDRPPILDLHRHLEIEGVQLHGIREVLYRPSYSTHFDVDEYMRQQEEARENLLEQAQREAVGR